jgi:hypothetical protein
MVVRRKGASGVSNDPFLQVWDDEGYLYVEAGLADDSQLDADLSIVDGKILIRIAKAEGYSEPTPPLLKACPRLG